MTTGDEPIGRVATSPAASTPEPDDRPPATAPPGGNGRSFVVSRPVAILMVFLAAVVFGAFSYRRLPVTLMPELSYPTLTVRTEYPGAAPEEVENDITRPVEEALGVIGGLRRISSVSRAGVSDVVLEFAWGTTMTDALQDTLEKLDLVFLPDEAERPLILRFDPSLDPVMELSLSGEGPDYQGEEGLRRLRRLAELQVKRALEPVRGVAAVRVRGGLEEEIHVVLDEEALDRTGLSVKEVVDRLAEENLNVAGGTLTEGRTEYMVRTLNEYVNLGQIADTIVSIRDDRPVRIRDLGEVVWSNAERQITTHTDGHPSVQLEVYKEADANIVDLAHLVRDRIGPVDREAKTAADAPGRGPRRGPPGRQQKGLGQELFDAEGAVLQVVADRSVFIEASIAEVRTTALLGGLLAVLVLFAFLRRGLPTAIIAVSIPISLLVTFAPLNMLGVSLNIMSLGGLALGIGMLVDSSIVVLESISRCRDEGDDLVQAAIRGTAEVRMAVAASTFTSIAVFLPMVFVEGVAGQAFGDLGLAVVVSLLVALVVAVAFIPMLASRTWRTSQRLVHLVDLLPLRSVRAFARDVTRLHGWRWLAVVWLVLRTAIGFFLELVLTAVIAVVGLAGVLTTLTGLLLGLFGRLARPLLDLFSNGLAWLTRRYADLLQWALGHSAIVIWLGIATLAATVWLGLGLDSELLPEVHQGEFTIEVQLPVGTPLEENEAVLGPVEQAILGEREHIESLLVTYGFDPTNSNRSDEGEHTARFKVILDSSDPRLEATVIDRMRRRFADLPDVDARVVRPVLFSFRTPIEVEVHGENLVALRQMAERVRDVMAGLPALADVETTQRAGAPEVQVRYNRDQLARYGLNIQAVAQEVRAAVKGDEATLFNLGDRRVPIVARFAEDDRRRVENVREFVVNPAGARPITLGAIADIELAEGPSEVRRVDGRRVALVTANLGAGSLGEAVAELEAALQRDIDWPVDMGFYVAGQSQEWQRSQMSLLLALGLSVFLVYVIMAAQFESLLQPLVIMLTIPLAFFGTVVALRTLHISLSVVVFLGMIMLAGIVVNNAIVLVDYINTLRRRGRDRMEAIITAGTVRLRPILMTTATTVLGLLPMAFGLGDGAEIRTPMAITVIAGLVASTVLTLVIIPSVYLVMDGLRERVLGPYVPGIGVGDST